MKRFIYITVLFLFAGVVQSYAQQAENEDIIQISGYIYANDSTLSPLPAARVMVAGTSRGRLADDNGFFSIAVLKTDTLVFSSLGFTGQKYHVKQEDQDKQSVTTAILLEPTTYGLDEVTVQGMSREAFKREFLAYRPPGDISPSAISVDELGRVMPDLTPGVSPGVTLSPTELIQQIPFVQRARFRKRAKEIREDPNVNIPEMK